MVKPEKEYDVIVIGGGINGLAAAAYLQKAGLKVAVFEKRDEAGTFCATEEVLHPGVKCNLHACWLIPHWSPAYIDLELEKFGLELLRPAGAEYNFFYPFKDGNALLFASYDARKSYEAWRRISEKDAETLRKIINFMAPMVIDFTDLALFTATTDDSFTILLSMVEELPVLPKDWLFMTGIELADTLFENEQIKTGLLAFASVAGGGLNYRITGPFTLLFFLSLWTCDCGYTCRGGSHNFVHSLVRCFVRHGGKIFYHCPVQKIIVDGNEAKGVVLSKEAIYPEAEFRASKAVISDLSAKPTFLQLVGEDKLPSWAIPPLKRYDYRGSTLFTNYYVLTEPPKWKAAEKFPEVNQCFTFNVGPQSVEEISKLYDTIDVRDLPPEPPGCLGLCGDFGLADPSQAPPGQRTLWTWALVPYELRPLGGPQKWDEIREEYGDKCEDLLAEFMPNLKKAKIARYCQSPYDYVRRNPHCMGNMHPSGAITDGQFWSWKPFQGCGAPRTPISKLYISQSMSSWNFSHLGPGYIAACAVAEDYGVRQQDWWRARACDGSRLIHKREGVEWRISVD